MKKLTLIFSLFLFSSSLFAGSWGYLNLVEGWKLNNDYTGINGTAMTWIGSPSFSATPVPLPSDPACSRVNGGMAATPPSLGATMNALSAWTIVWYLNIPVGTAANKILFNSTGDWVYGNWYVGDVRLNGQIGTGIVPTRGAWQEWRVEWTGVGGAMNLYIDRQLAGSVAKATNPFPTNTSFYFRHTIGIDSGVWFVDDVFFFSVALGTDVIPYKYLSDQYFFDNMIYFDTNYQ